MTKAWRINCFLATNVMYLTTGKKLFSSAPCWCSCYMQVGFVALFVGTASSCGYYQYFNLAGVQLLIGVALRLISWVWRLFIYFKTDTSQCHPYANSSWTSTRAALWEKKCPCLCSRWTIIHRLRLWWCSLYIAMWCMRLYTIREWLPLLLLSSKRGYY